MSGGSWVDLVIEAARRRTADRLGTPAARELARRAARRSPRGDEFVRALVRGAGPRVIAECKRRSPSGRLLRPAYDPAALARSYDQAGAVAVSVLTETRFFGGTPADLEAVRAAVNLPVLRKDFVVCEDHILEARAWGADAVLLIVTVLEDEELTRLHQRVEEEGMAALVEVHDERELDRALAAGARIVGVNTRNLRTLEARPELHEGLIPRLPSSVLAVAESGLRARGQLLRLEELGYHAFLVGERLVTRPDAGAALAELLEDAPAEGARA